MNFDVRIIEVVDKLVVRNFIDNGVVESNSFEVKDKIAIEEAIRIAIEEAIRMAIDTIVKHFEFGYFEFEVIVILYFHQGKNALQQAVCLQICFCNSIQCDLFISILIVRQS